MLGLGLGLQNRASYTDPQAGASASTTAMAHEAEDETETETESESVEMLRLRHLTERNAVMVFSRRGCCMCSVVKALLCALGVTPCVCEIDDDRAMDLALATLLPKPKLSVSVSVPVPVPLVFIGGQLLGGLDSLITSHISGDLVPLLKRAGALWL